MIWFLSRSKSSERETETGVVDPAEFAQVVARAKCRVFGEHSAGNDAHRCVAARLIAAFDRPDSIVLCEPSLVSNTRRPPDVVLIDPVAGVHVVEVKGVTAQQVEAVQPGGEMRIRYSNGVAPKNVIKQVQGQMFAIRDAVSRIAGEPAVINFEYWVVFPLIPRADWRFAFQPEEFVFQADLAGLADRMRRKGADRRRQLGRQAWASEQCAAILRAFGDNAVLIPDESRRPGRRVAEGTLGDRFDDAAIRHRNLTDEQQALSVETWDLGPRLVRGVAGSGKTIVLANNLARRIDRAARSQGNLLVGSAGRPRLAAVCFNRTLVPFLREKIARAYRQRTGIEIDDRVDLWVGHFNSLCFELSQSGVWPYMTVEEARRAASGGGAGLEPELRARHFLASLVQFKAAHSAEFERVGFDSIYVDEGQDLHPLEFQLLAELCRRPPQAEPNLIVFYDDAQNLYGRPRPSWKELGLNLVGARSRVMTTCHRNPRAIVESAFNVLYGTCAPTRTSVPSREFGDVATLTSKGLIRDQEGYYKVEFAQREAQDHPRCTILGGGPQELAYVVERVRWLLIDQQVRPQDLLVVAPNRACVQEIVRALEVSPLPGMRVHDASIEKDSLIGAPGTLTVSTVHSAKGYDAFAVMVVAANQFQDSVTDRALFYVACTRAIEWLEVTAHARSGLVVEFERALQRV